MRVRSRPTANGGASTLPGPSPRPVDLAQGGQPPLALRLSCDNIQKPSVKLLSLTMNMRARLTPEETATASWTWRRSISGALATPRPPWPTSPRSSACRALTSTGSSHRSRRSTRRSAAASGRLPHDDAARRRGARHPAERLETLIIAVHDYNARCYTSERRLHDMVEAAMEENWPVIQQHLAFVVETFAGLISEGVDRRRIQAGLRSPPDGASSSSRPAAACCTP